MSLQLGLVVHPRRDVQEALAVVHRWAQPAGARIIQVEVPGQQQVVAPIGPVEDCDVVAAVGGDGTALAAIRAAAPAQVPVLGIACGSLGALTSVEAQDLGPALSSFEQGEWQPRSLPALHVEREHEPPMLAYNDIAVVRRGEGQVRCSARVDGELFARLAGDGCIVSTAVGSSAYGFAAGGPLLAPGADAFLLTPLSNHGGSCPPLVIAGGSRLEVEARAGFGGTRLEVDGRIAGPHAGWLAIRLQGDVATLVSFAGQESFLAGLRRRGVISDSPRILAEDEREESN